MKKYVLLLNILLLSAWSPSFGQNFNITFQVDMTVQIAKGAFNTATDTVQARGDFNGWGSTNMAPVSKGSMIYAATIAVPSGTAHYKFYFKDSGTDYWESDQPTSSKNRELAVSADATVPAVLFNGEAMPSGNKAVVKFTADMRLPIIQASLDLKTGKVYVAGDFNSWSTSATQLAGPATDSTYTVRVDTIKSGTLIHYKFLYVDVKGATQWEGDPNKTLWVVDDSTQNVIKRFYNNVDPHAVALKDGAINFEADMTVMTNSLGLFKPATDTLKLRGAFNGWSDATKSKAYMTQDPITPGSYFISIPFSQEKVSSPELYKFRMERKTPSSVLTGDAQYERPLSTGGGNRSVNFAGTANQNTDPATVYFDDISPKFIIQAGTKVTANFSVDMTKALDASTSGGDVFDPAQDSVFLVCGQGVWGQIMGGTGGWKEDGDRALLLTKSSGNIYSGSVTIPAPGFNGFMYTYEFAHKANATLTKEVTGFANWDRRVRYIPMTGPNKFVQPYTAVVDHWTKNEVKDSTEYEKWPVGLSTGVKELNTSTPIKYTLEQNYPNPFNPSTKINFSLHNDEMVSLKIYNILGQVVVTLVNQQMKQGSYSYDFNASRLSSGVYFYRLQAGSFTSVKKMLLLK
jgi:Secretion system C-terminal sorting domain/Starch binding domain